VRFNARGIVTRMGAGMNQVKNVFSRRKDSICSEKRPTLPGDGPVKIEL
jgi:hypothetical protein